MSGADGVVKPVPRRISVVRGNGNVPPAARCSWLAAGGTSRSTRPLYVVRHGVEENSPEWAIRHRPAVNGPPAEADSAWQIQARDLVEALLFGRGELLRRRHLVPAPHRHHAVVDDGDHARLIQVEEA